MKKIVLFGAGKSATCLIDYLVRESTIHDWEFILVDANLHAAETKIAGAPNARAVCMQVEDETVRISLILEANIVISLLPPSLHWLIARDCLQAGRNLLTASYVDDKISGLRSDIQKKGLLFLCEMGLDPGIDHMSAMEIIHRIHSVGGRIRSFKSHTGGLIAPESDDNPWHYKISWNPRNIVLAGKAGATYKLNGQIIRVQYEELFENCHQVTIPGLGALAYYPNRDSLSYIPVYGLEEASTFIRTTLRYPAFCEHWNWIVKAGLTNENSSFNPKDLHFADWSAPIMPWVNKMNRETFSWLGFFENGLVPENSRNSADVLQFLLETRLSMQPEDKDMIVMLHEFEYDLNEKAEGLRSLLIVKGEDRLRTAMAKTVGLPLGIAAKLILEDKMALTGLHIPIHPAIYLPILKELKSNGIDFTESVS